MGVVPERFGEARRFLFPVDEEVHLSICMVILKTAAQTMKKMSNSTEIKRFFDITLLSFLHYEESNLPSFMI